MSQICLRVPSLYPNVDCVLLSYHCHTFCHTVVIPWASIWSLGRFCQFCLAVLSKNLPRRMCQANLPHVVIPVVIPLLSHLVVIPVVNRCCHTRVYVLRLPTQIGTRPYGYSLVAIQIGPHKGITFGNVSFKVPH